MAEHVEERKLISAVEWQDKSRKRGTVMDGLIGWTDDGYVVHIPTGHIINPPKGPDGAYREDVTDDRAFVTWMLDQDPEGWSSSRNYKFGEHLKPPLAERLIKTRDSFPV